MLDLAIVWHLHQPPYQDPVTNEIILPWVRLHGAKDYLDMVSLLDEFPDIRLNFNITPCLIEQILDYGNKQDRFEQLTLKRPFELTDDEKIELLRYAFQVPIETMIKPFPRYLELLEKRGRDFDLSDSATIRKFLPEDFRDLQVLANLVWIDPLFRNYPPIAALFAKHRNYTEEDKEIVLKYIREILSQVLSKYRLMAEAGKIELITSPFNHPILPLLCDANSAYLANPSCRVPDWDFKFPEDAIAQVEQGIDLFTKNFGLKPNGIWLPEAAVSYETIRILAKMGIFWTITDETILAKSLGIVWQRDTNSILDNGKSLYTPYQMNFENHSVNILFRDASFSDLIGFEYGRWDSIRAAEDFYHRLNETNSKLPKAQNHLMVIALDGENPWEYYENDGLNFLRHLYELLSQARDIRTVKISDFLANKSDFPKLNRLLPGSWVNGNFDIWAGSEEDARAWKMLAKTRADLITYEKKIGKRIDHAWQEIYRAEASDWFWWFGEEHYSVFGEVFDSLFRKHLIQVYKIIHQPPPFELAEPIKKITKRYEASPRNYIKPIIDGKETNFYEWLGAGYFDLAVDFRAMHKSSNWFKRVLYGFDENNVYLRIELVKKVKLCMIELIGQKTELILNENNAYLTRHGEKSVLEAAYDQFYELKIPLALLDKPISQFQLLIRLFDNGSELDVSPVLKIEILDDRSKARFWAV